MNDPQVVALIYHIEHNESVSYEDAKPFVRDEPEFRVKIKDKEVCFEFKKHYATESEARESIKKYIRVWEFDAGLRGDPDDFKLKFDRAKIVDRKPTPGKISVSATPVRLEVAVSVPAVTKAPSNYPSPPSGLFIDPDVQTLYDRYMHYRRGHELLPGISYFCLTFLESTAMARTKNKFREHQKRQAAADYYHIEENVLKRIGYISSEKGGPLEARKRDGIDHDLTAQERSFLQKAVKKMIYRMAEKSAAEKANAPTKNLSQISLSDLPPV